MTHELEKQFLIRLGLSRNSSLKTSKQEKKLHVSGEK